MHNTFFSNLTMYYNTYGTGSWKKC